VFRVISIARNNAIANGASTIRSRQTISSGTHAIAA
jgi:hypothetical protein